LGDGGLDEGGRVAAKIAFDEMLKRLFPLGGPFFMMDFGSEGMVTLEVKPFEGKIRLSFITVPEEFRGKGLASKALRFLTDIADKHGVPISLDVSPQGEGGFTKAQLFRWYERHGFRRLPYTMQKKLSDMMEREPRSREAVIASRVAREILSVRVVVDENYVRGLKHMMASDIRALERAINRPEDVAGISRMVSAVEQKWENVFYQVMLSKEMAELSWGSKDESYLSKKLRASAWNAVMAFHEIMHQLLEWPRHWSKYPNDFNREKKYVFDKIKRYAREAYEDALILAQSRTEEQRIFDFGEKTTVGGFVLVPEAGILENKMREAAELMKQVQSVVSRSGFEGVLNRMVVHVTAQSKAGLVGGEYQPKNDSMNILPIGMSVETIVHELGHRNWYQVLSPGDREYWKAAFEGDLTEITKADVEDIIERAHKLKDEGEGLTSAIRGAISAYVAGHKEDPLVPYKVAYFKDNVHFHDDFDFWANVWRKDLVGQRVMKNLISDYANTNEKEAYAEVFQHYVMRKPIPDVVLYWFS
jgi:GNAT superfamily N-acetyltransferase